MAQSLDTAASSADKLIQLVAQARPEVLGHNASLAVVPAHIHWGPFHCFSAAMFFSLQLVADPHQPGASLFRANIKRVLELLDMSRGVAIADKASNMLRAMRPLYDSDFDTDDETERRRLKGNVIALVKSLAFPYHDSFASHGCRSHHADSPRSIGAVMSPTTVRTHGLSSGASNASSPGGVPAPMVSPSLPRSHTGITPAPPYSRNGTHTQLADILAPTDANTKPADYSNYPSHNANGSAAATNGLRPTPTFPLPASAGGAFSSHAQQGPDGVSMWGASVGFGQGEWTRFLDVLERTEGSGLMTS